MNIAAGRFGDQEVDPGLGQYLGLLVEVRLGLGLGGLAAARFVVSLAGNPQAEVRHGTGNQHRTVPRLPVAGVLGQHDGAQVEFDNLVAETDGLEVVACRCVGVGGDDVGTGSDVLFVHAAHGEGMGLQRRPRPGQPGHGHTHALEPGADGAVEHDDLALRHAPLKIRVRVHTALPGLSSGSNTTSPGLPAESVFHQLRRGSMRTP